ncbi:H-2 class II histocompatibility antigen, E-S beta chain isoform X1 [Scophthalmus maximus]|uniref:H-2 class II histocompatibility antigen, E-S beta chain isoform X1 n=1 Tax=Scophthalmus maximus TaxID=52904 RepID=UPI0015E0A573|nr:H-2 class II histocompatibility antigen, E-S beta chain isoform X1 [Scophthalmus maximus]
MHIHSFCSLLSVFLLFSMADAFFIYGLIRCQFTSTQDVVYLEQIYFNKKLIGQYNSSLGKFVGYKKYTKKVADNLNKNPSMLKQERKNEEKCRIHVPLAYYVFSKTVEPYVRLRSAELISSRHPIVLICSVYNFYPKNIRVTWLRNGEPRTSDVTFTDELANGNWLYQIHSHLEYTPRLGEKITCMVEHASFKDPKHYDWDPMPESDRVKIAVGTAGLLLGSVVLLAGVIYYKRNRTGRVLVPVR